MTKSKIHIAIRWISCALFLVGLLAPAHTNYTNLEQSNFMFVSIKVIFLLSPCVLLIYRGNLGVFCDLRLIKQFGFYFCFLFYCGLSVLFSADPTLSLLKFAALLIGSLSSMCLVIDISNRPPTQASLRLFMVMLIVSLTLITLLVFSYMVAGVRPSYPTYLASALAVLFERIPINSESLISEFPIGNSEFPIGNDIASTFTINGLSTVGMSALIACVIIHTVISKPINWMQYALNALIVTVGTSCLFTLESRTSLLALLVSLFSFFLYRRALKALLGFLLFVVCFLLTVATFYFVANDDLLLFFSKGNLGSIQHLSHRLGLWSSAFSQNDMARVFFGNGFSLLSQSGTLTYKGTDIQTYHAHNSLIQVFLGTGVVGTFLLTGQVGLSAKFLFWESKPGRTTYFLRALAIYIALLGVTHSIVGWSLDVFVPLFLILFSAKFIDGQINEKKTSV